jgi:hypothetical protein
MGGEKMGSRKLILIAIAIVLFISCRSVKYVPVTKTVTRTEYTVDTLVEYQLVPYHDSVAVDDTVSFLFNDYAYSYAMWSSGKLHHSLAIFPQKPILIEVPRTIVEVHETDPQIVEVEKKLTSWQKVKMNVGGAVIIIDALLLIGLFVCLVFRRTKS